MKTRKEALNYGLKHKDTYVEAPFHDDNWQLVRVKGSKKAFLWTYERNGYINLNGIPLATRGSFISIANTGKTMTADTPKPANAAIPIRIIIENKHLISLLNL